MSTPAEDIPVAGTVVLLRPGTAGFEVLLMRRPERGSFAGAWVFPGGKVEQSDRRSGADESGDAARAAMRETVEEVGVVVADVVVLSRWEPPREAPVRIRTWFFLALAPDADQELSLSEGEVEAAEWLTPADALARHGRGEWMLFPPTWITLDRLSRFETADAALAAAGVAQLFATTVTRSAEGVAFEWGSLRLETGSLPWRLVGD